MTQEDKKALAEQIRAKAEEMKPLLEAAEKAGLRVVVGTLDIGLRTKPKALLEVDITEIVNY